MELEFKSSHIWCQSLNHLTMLYYFPAYVDGPTVASFLKI